MVLVSWEGSVQGPGLPAELLAPAAIAADKLAGMPAAAAAACTASGAGVSGAWGENRAGGPPGGPGCNAGAPGGPGDNAGPPGGPTAGAKSAAMLSRLEMRLGCGAPDWSRLRRFQEQSSQDDAAASLQRRRRKRNIFKQRQLTAAAGRQSCRVRCRPACGALREGPLTCFLRLLPAQQPHTTNSSEPLQSAPGLWEGSWPLQRLQIAVVRLHRGTDEKLYGNERDL